ncbi:TPA: right-handed parallel beta-helix repeat-containing protein [bacterium]|nr:right-handed parallel beta-helix repeat-containing protein [bacterium]
MKIILFLLVISPIVISGCMEGKKMSESKGLTLYVAVNGNDSNSGHTADKPFATLERARDEIRKIKKLSGLPKDGITIELAGGIYQREKVFELNADDSGSKDAPIIYKAKEGDQVRITGGRVVNNFELVADQEVLKRLDPEVHGKIYQADLKSLGITDYGNVNGGGLELFFNDKPMTLSRWPNDDFIKIVGLVGGEPVDVRGTKGDQIGKFMYEGDRPKRWVGEKDPWVHGYWFWDWSDQRHPVESIDTEKHIISVKPPYHGYGYRIGQWFYALNILAEIDMPNEWYLDRETGILYFYPPSPIESGQAVVSIQKTAINMNDVSYITIEGMTFEATRDTAITMSGGTGNRISNCTLRNLGRGITISGGTDNGVIGCDIYEIANGGISLSGGERRTLTPAGLFAENNDIYNYGRWNRMYQSAISIGGVGNRASNNRLHDAPHIAIMFGGNDHVIEYNEIYNVCYESNDAGAIYSGRDWTMRGTEIRYNYLHDISGFEGKGCVGVYLDDMYCGTLIYGNLFYKVTMAAFIGGGRDCTIENNIFVDCVPSIHIDARAMGWASDHVDTTMTDRLNDMPYKNELWSKRYPELVNILNDEPAAPKGNLVIRNISVGGRWDGIYNEAKPYVTVKDNLVDEDPHFVKQPPESFELKEDSPAYKLGFKKIPIEKIGLKRK